ncbi:hypothetical protein AKG34_07190 [Peribacillus butanolivorans]|uniref:hypothetical protein n=1 Tax=Peribacillus butanolivorans TaxID=421767 RepID=UPI0006A6BDA1|nr:hypothetical protein [Peribacillus butanolivorans]KON68619.1 hypothetical protein AKG34_07190 [Peribacillus butanolivorans]
MGFLDFVKSRNKELEFMLDFDLIEDTSKKFQNETIIHSTMYQYDWPHYQPIRILCIPFIHACSLGKNQSSTMINLFLK